MKRPLIMFVSPDAERCEQFLELAAKHFRNRMELVAMPSAEAGIVHYQSRFGTGFHFAVAISEDELPGRKGVEFLQQISADFPETRTVLISDTQDIARLRTAKNLANLHCYLTGAWSLQDLLQATLQALAGYLRYLDLTGYTELLQDLNRSAQEISGELNSQKLRENFLWHLLSNTEADTAYLLIENDGRLELEAAYHKLELENRILSSRLRNDYENLQKEVLTRVKETSAAGEDYSHRVLTPILRGKRLRGYLFVELENPNDYFADAHRECVSMMASQLSISLENIGLIQQLEFQQTELQRNNAVLNEKVEDIMASIRYAQRIQAAILPNLSLLSAYVPEHFLVFQPREMVSGNFFWFIEEGNNFFIAVADCAGWGVPGAFMSVMLRNFLNQAVKEFGLQEPSAVLEFVDNRLKLALKYDRNTSENPETLQVALCLYEAEERSLVFCGAGRHLVLVRQDDLFIIDGDGRQLGDISAREVFTAKQLNLQPDDRIYLFTDGIENQPGEVQNEPFGQTALFKTLHAYRSLPMPEQRQKLMEALAAWSGNLPVADDLLVIGLRFA